MNVPQTIAILGGGPIGIEAALAARDRGYRPVVYERDEVGAHMLRWGFVELFTPWKLNTSELGLETLQRRGRAPPAPDVLPTGREFVTQYLRILADDLGECVKEQTEVAGVARVGLLKTENIAGRRRARTPFRILLRKSGAEAEVSADIVFDTTGVYANAAHLGDGGIPALGESTFRDRIDYHLRDVLHEDRALFAGRTILVVGAGYSAATALRDLVALAAEEPNTRIVWIRRSTGPKAFPTYDNDPLPAREALAAFGNSLAADPPKCCDTYSGVSVRSLSDGATGKIEVDLRPVEGGGTPATVLVDRILAHVGYRPDMSIVRELQIHQCYATDGPMALAAALMAQGGNGDCLGQSSGGPDTLKNPEPNFFILGNKSFGRRSDFLLRVGREQIEDAFRCMETTRAKTTGTVASPTSVAERGCRE